MLTTILIGIIVIMSLFILVRELSRSSNEKLFLSIVNHNFRTPLTRIKWMSDALKEEQTREEKVETARNVSNSVNRILEIIDTLVGVNDIHNMAAYDLKAVSLREIIEEAIAKYRTMLNDKKILLEIPTFSDIPLLTLDTKKISFVVHVLLENAIFYSNPNGHIRIGVTLKESGILMGIQDEGIGLTWKDKFNLFNRFYRGEQAQKMNTDGMGLGLFISRQIIRRHSGKIYATSKGKDTGSSFYIRLPLNR